MAYSPEAIALANKLNGSGMDDGRYDTDEAVKLQSDWNAAHPDQPLHIRENPRPAGMARTGAWNTPTNQTPPQPAVPVAPPIGSGNPGGPQPGPTAIGGLPPPGVSGTDTSGPLEGLKGAGPSQPVQSPSLTSPGSISKPPEPDSQDEGTQSTWLTGKKPAQPGAPLQGLLSAMPQPDMPQAKQLPKQLGGLAY